jgi:hypothetical protein
MVVTGLGLLYSFSLSQKFCFCKFSIGGNPVSVLQTQTNLDLVPVKHKCPMYECSQNVV